MKKTFFILMVFTVVGFIACKKKDPSPTTEPAPASVNTDTYTSLKDFYFKNGVKKQTFLFNANNGGSFITAQGTTLQIPSGCFSGNGIVSLEFSDIYKKSDMLLSNMGTRMFGGAPLLSGGEFFIRARVNGLPAQITNSMAISILQPKNPNDTMGMQAFVAVNDTAANFNFSWVNSPDNVQTNATNYVFSLYQFKAPVDSGSWCNSDNPGYFSAYPQTVLTMHPSQTGYQADVFLVFKNIKSMVHVYDSSGDFPYFYAPVGLQCTIVALGLKDGKLQSSFIPITISNNQTVNFTLAETTTEAFKASLKALD